jgi:long-chain acyl-CoA synthetase
VPSGDLGERVRGLVAQASHRPLAQVDPASSLALDLGLDSLGRVELAALLEAELGRVLSDERLAAIETVAELIEAIAAAGPAASAEPLPAWPRSRLARLLRGALQQLLLLPLLRHYARPFEARGAERLAEVPWPALLIANHASHVDSLTVLSLLPPGRRGRVAVAAAADYFFQSRPLSLVSALALGAFPFHRQGPVATSLAHCGDLVADGFGILIFPEGTRSPDGRLQPFKAGIGLLARELGIPVVPIHLAGPHAILPKGASWPRRAPLRATVGEPLRLDPGLSNPEAVSRLESALRALAAPSEPPVAPRS